MRISKRIAFVASAAAAVGIVGAASAADIPPRTYTKAPATAATVYDWSGLYIGGNVGVIWGRSSGTSNIIQLDIFDSNTHENLTDPRAEALRKSAAIGGIHAGYNWQMAR